MSQTKKEKKHSLGQFFTTNQEYILQNLNIPEDIITVIEPFTGDADLLNFLDQDRYIIECFDIEPKHDFIIQKDTILHPPDYRGKFILTNPPFLARNKSKDKTHFDKYRVNDLYKCFIKELFSNTPIGGIIIIPLNFWCSIRKADVQLRKEFLNIFEVVHLNIFEEHVFEDTTVTVCSFQFTLRTETSSNEINVSIYPSNILIMTTLTSSNNYMMGGDIYNLETKNEYKITRLTSKNKSKQNTNILVKCIDDNENSKIGLSIVNDNNIYIDDTPNQTARTYATLVIEPQINLEKQQDLVERFNKFLEDFREDYHSLFLNNYRESKDIARKRISFDLVYKITEFILDNKM